MGFDWNLISPEIAVLVTGFVILIADLFLKRGRNAIFATIGFVGIMVTIALVFRNFDILRTVTEGASIGFQNMVINDRISLYFKVIFCMGTLLTLFVSVTYVQRELKGAGEYYTLLFIATFGMMVMASSMDLFTVFLGLEVMSIPLYVLAGMYRRRARAREASLKYFLMGAFASGFLLFGIALIFGAFGSTNMIDICKRFGYIDTQGMILAGAGTIFALIGFAFKIGVAPFHMWVPDVYEGAAVPATAFMSAGPKAAAFAVLFRMVSVFWPALEQNLGTILWILAALTMTWGNILAISQTNIKRMLAYSSIAHAGYVMIALTVGGPEGLASGAFYLLVYTIVNIGAFSIVTLFVGKGEKQEKISDFAGFGHKYPFAGISLTIFMFALAGIPATAGFIGKYKIFIAALNSGFIWLPIIGIANSLISVWYYIGVVVTMYMKPANAEARSIDLSPTLLVAILVALIGTIGLGLFPDLWVGLADEAGRHLGAAYILGSLLN
ncbi:MAG: NADH-quinone oxidoreductase subunit N [candidate division Zixibacteria bacterium]